MHFRSKPLLIIYTGILFVSCTDSVNTKSEPASVFSDSGSVKQIKKPVLMYGIPSDSFNIITGHIKPNRFLSEILIDHGVPMKDIDQIAKNSRSVFDVRKVRAGNNYILLCDKDSFARARYFVYEHDATTSYVFSFNDSLNITPFRKEIRSEIKFASVTIETSLWDAIINSGCPPTLVFELSDIFAWTVDFFGLQKGDSLKVIYEELFIGDKSLGAGKIYGAQFKRSANSIFAIPFIQDGKESFFDINGTSLKKAFLKAPLQFSRITSRFSSARMHPILRIVRPHYGVDYAAPVGTPVCSIGDGRITSMGEENGSGRMVRIQHNSVYATAYLHLSRFGAGITPGAFVKQGDIIGYVGSSGLSTGPHLDFRFYRNGSPVDPFKVDAPPVDPVSERNIAKFERIKTVILSLLGTVD
jgi:murein DD-endopeptidase MepM/ murein hydrolase activator NlpD